MVANLSLESAIITPHMLYVMQTAVRDGVRVRVSLNCARERAR